jgi:hypothetical protein
VAATIMQDRGLSDHRPPRRSPHMARCRHMALDRGPRAHPLQLFAALAFVLAASLSLPGCTAQLAPDYDKTIVDGLTTVNEQTLILFASISSGASRASFSAREPNYDSIIGKFDALRLQAMARPTPQPWLLKAFGSSPKQESDASDHLKSPTPDIINTIKTLLTRMREQDKAGTLTAEVVNGLYKNSYELAIIQALTYENALQR